MELWLFRHGKAESGGLQVSDEDRALIERGREDVAFMANQLQKDWEGKSVEFWSSPLKRARETTDYSSAHRFRSACAPNTPPAIASAAPMPPLAATRGRGWRYGRYSARN